VEAANVERFGILGHRTAQQSHAQLLCMTTELLGSHGTAGTQSERFSHSTSESIHDESGYFKHVESPSHLQSSSEPALCH